MFCILKFNGSEEDGVSWNLEFLDVRIEYVSKNLASNVRD